MTPGLAIIENTENIFSLNEGLIDFRAKSALALASKIEASIITCKILIFNNTFFTLLLNTYNINMHDLPFGSVS